MGGNRTFAALWIEVRIAGQTCRWNSRSERPLFALRVRGENGKAEEVDPSCARSVFCGFTTRSDIVVAYHALRHQKSKSVYQVHLPAL